MGWRYEPPEAWVNAEKVSAQKLTVQARDNLRAIYSPPQVRAAGQGNQGLTVNTFQMIDFPNTVFDNDGMHGGTIGVQNEPERGLITVQTAGKYLVRVALDWQWFTSGAQFAFIGVRAVPTNAWYLFAADVGGPMNSGGPHTITTAEQAFPCSPGFQFAMLGLGTVEGGNETIAEYNLPLIYVHWLGGP